MLDFLVEQPLLALIVILAVGLALGKIRVFGISLGAAAVLFVALGLATANPEISVPPLLYQLGLAMFVYVIGLSAGPAFFREFRSRGWRLNLFAFLIIVALVGLAYGLIRLFGLDPLAGAGMFTGALTSTPGMAAIVDMVDPADSQTPVVGYSLAYPGAVLGMIIVAAVGAALLKVNHTEDARKSGMIPSPLVWTIVRITNPAVRGRMMDLEHLADTNIVATRIIDPDGQHRLADPTSVVHPGMQVLIHGTGEKIADAVAYLGEEVDIGLGEDELTYKRITVSNPDVVGRPLHELDTAAQGFLIARVRSGDVDRVPRADTVLNYSDRVRVVAAPGHMPQVRKYLGDSERSLGDVDLFPFALGLAIGLLLGTIPIPLPGGSVLTLGFGGGPIIAGLVLGWLNRTGPINWQLPFHANKTISTLGLALFLAGVGTSAGAGFRQALTDSSSLLYILGGLIITLTCAIGVGVLGRTVLKLPWDEAMGVAGGISTNPAVLSYLNTQTGTELPGRGYATVYPTAMIAKIVAAQVLLLLLL